MWRRARNHKKSKKTKIHPSYITPCFLPTTHLPGRIMTGTALAMQKLVSQLARVVMVMPFPRRRWGKISADTTQASGPHLEEGMKGTRDKER